MINRSIGSEEMFMLGESNDVSGSLFEFGVYCGNCMRVLVNTFQIHGKPFDEIWGFDSFVGLPDEDPNVYAAPNWNTGDFNIVRDYRTDIDGVKQIIYNNVGRKDIHLIPGFFSDSLTDELGATLGNKCGFLHVDCDLYISAKQCLDWVFKHAILKNNCIIRYDDWECHPEWQAGESLAHLEIQAKYKVEFDRLAKNVFKVVNYERGK